MDTRCVTKSNESHYKIVLHFETYVLSLAFCKDELQWEELLMPSTLCSQMCARCLWVQTEKDTLMV